MPNHVSEDQILNTLEAIDRALAPMPVEDIHITAVTQSPKTREGMQELMTLVYGLSLRTDDIGGALQKLAMDLRDVWFREYATMDEVIAEGVRYELAWGRPSKYLVERLAAEESDGGNIVESGPITMNKVPGGSNA